MGKRQKYNYEEFVGSRIGDLTIVDLIYKNGKHLYYKCDCICGATDLCFEARTVVENRRTNCGKCHLYKSIGEKFHRLTVYEIRNNKCVCRCDCGTENYECKLSELKRGHRQSCGCILLEKKNRFQKFDTYAMGTTNKGIQFYFDIEDYEKVSQHTWRVNNNGYLVANIWIDEKRKVIEMHRYLFKVQEGLYIDHINRNKLDNRSCNLRYITPSSNGFNADMQGNNTSGKVGVSYNKQNNNWVAHIGYNFQHIYLGSYIRFEDAVRAREAAELKYFGEKQEIEYRDDLTQNSFPVIRNNIN